MFHFRADGDAVLISSEQKPGAELYRFPGVLRAVPNKHGVRGLKPAHEETYRHAAAAGLSPNVAISTLRDPSRHIQCLLKLYIPAVLFCCGRFVPHEQQVM